jgi:hypothetical protein
VKINSVQEVQDRAFRALFAGPNEEMTMEKGGGRLTIFTLTIGNERG